MLVIGSYPTSDFIITLGGTFHGKNCSIGRNGLKTQDPVINICSLRVVACDQRSYCWEFHLRK